MAKRPRNKKVDRSIIDQGGITPIRALTVALLNRKERKEDEEYQDALREMGMFEEGGGRANVPRKFRGMMKSEGGRLKRSVDGVATRGLTRAATKGFGKVG